LEIKD